MYHDPFALAGTALPSVLAAIVVSVSRFLGGKGRMYGQRLCINQGDSCFVGGMRQLRVSKLEAVVQGLLLGGESGCCFPSSLRQGHNRLSLQSISGKHSLTSTTSSRFGISILRGHADYFGRHTILFPLYLLLQLFYYV